MRFTPLNSRIFLHLNPKSHLLSNLKGRRLQIYLRPFSWLILRLPFLFFAVRFFILRSREPPGCGSSGNEHISVCYLNYIQELYIKSDFEMRLFLAGNRSILFLYARTIFSRLWYDLCPVLWSAFTASYSSVCPSAFFLGCALFWAITGIVLINFHIRQRIASGFFHAWTLLSCCLDPLTSSVCFHGYIFTRIASSQVPFLTIRSRSRFSGGSFF